MTSDPPSPEKLLSKKNLEYHGIGYDKSLHAADRLPPHVSFLQEILLTFDRTLAYNCTKVFRRELKMMMSDDCTVPLQFATEPPKEAYASELQTIAAGDKDDGIWSRQKLKKAQKLSFKAQKCYSNHVDEIKWVSLLQKTFREFDKQSGFNESIRM
jgi:hypothetical protein